MQKYGPLSTRLYHVCEIHLNYKAILKLPNHLSTFDLGQRSLQNR